MIGFLRTCCIGLIGDAYLSRYPLKEFGGQEGQVVHVEV